MQYDKHGVHFVLLRDLSSPCYEIVRKRPFDVSLCLLLRYYKADVILSAWVEKIWTNYSQEVTRSRFTRLAGHGEYLLDSHPAATVR